MKKFVSSIISAILLVMTPTAFGLSAEDIYRKVNPSIYTIYTVNFYTKKPDSLGSAVAVTDHILATNCHVALTGNYLGVVVNKEFKLGTLFFRDVKRDICFVEIPGMKFTPVKMRDTKGVQVGEEVFAIGNPEGLEKSISKGIISNKRESQGGYVLQTDASVSVGSSGGGLFDQNGQLVGITNSVDRYSKNITFALPSEWISQVLFPKESSPRTTQAAREALTSHENKPITKVGNYGDAGVSLYRYHKKCFVLFTGKNKNGNTVGSAIWYPEKPGVMLVFPDSKEIEQDFQIMNAAFYGAKNQKPIYSRHVLVLGNKAYQLVGIQDPVGRYPLLVTRLSEDAVNQLQTMDGFTIKYGDVDAVQRDSAMTFGLKGLKESMGAYQGLCKAQNPSV